MKRDVAIIPLSDEEELVIAADNSGAIGMRDKDEVQVPYEVVSYFNFRVAWMECVAAGAKPFAVIVHNFSGDKAWDKLIKGIHRGTKELGITDLDITGSTETNFSLMQSAVGLNVIGRKKKKIEQACIEQTGNEIIKAAVIGEPLAGNEVIENKHAIAPLKLFQWFANQQDVLSILPVGSKGILYELEQLFTGPSRKFATDLDMRKTSGPATSFIVVYKQAVLEKVKEKAGNLFHEVIIE
ncbi:ATP-binding protein [Virgibacillus sp. YIM 98842]|uniref:ATP-binding protein n=1 Tax=Virgibacillus sp. YIM 98842 TaxID=2663533 RepID=UPI0013DD0B3D|nr:ATP-binding protein [Virgibacillus sp. YIM 98842]